MLTNRDVTAIVTNFNYGVYLSSCLDSLLNGKIVPHKIIVVDDASIDNSLDILDKYRDIVEIRVNEENLGITESYNRVLDTVKTSWVFILDADNIVSFDYVSNFLEASRNFDETVVIAYTDMFLFGRNARELAENLGCVRYFESQISAYAFLWKFPDFTETLKIHLNQENFIHGNSFFRLDRFREVGKFKFEKPEDHNLWKRMISPESHFKAIRLLDAKLGYRQHSQLQVQKIVELKSIISSLYVRIFELEKLVENLQNVRNQDNININSVIRRSFIKRVRNLESWAKQRSRKTKQTRLERFLWKKMIRIYKNIRYFS